MKLQWYPASAAAIALSWGIPSACAQGGTPYGPPTPAPTDQEAARVIAQVIESEWPQSGAVFATYGYSTTRIMVGIDFGSGAWYYLTGAPNLCVGQDPLGHIYDGRAERGGFRQASYPRRGDSFVLDEFFPTFALRELLLTPSALEICSPTTDGGVDLVFRLPRGSRQMTVLDMGEPELARWGGLDTVYRRLLVRLAPEYRVESMHLEGEQSPEPKVRDALCSKAGFQIAAISAIRQGLVLTSCEFSEGVSTARFEMANVEVGAVAAFAPTALPRTPVQLGAGGQESAKEGSPTTELRTDTGRTRWWLVGGGCVLLGLALIAVVRQRTSGP